MKLVSIGIGILANLFVVAFAVESNQDLVPNGRKFNPSNVKSSALGHKGIAVDGSRNVFGRDFDTNLGNWASLCPLDSDGDNFTNGEELGDPNCTWTSGPAPAPLQSDPADPNSIPGSGIDPAAPPSYVLAHGLLMICAWVILAPIGVGAPLIFKKAGGSNWFKVHRFALLGAALLTLTAFAVMFSLGGGASILFSGPHTIIGLIVTVGTILQIVSGLFRPHIPQNSELKDEKRLIWEFGHQWSGRLLLVLAFFCIMTGLNIGFGTTEATTAGIILFVWLFVAGAFGVGYVVFVRDGRLNAPFEQQPKDKVQA